MEKLSIRLANLLLKKHCIEESMHSIYQYGLQMILEVGCSFITSIIICCLCGMIVEGIVFFSVFIPLRSYLGGFHMKSYGACFICSSITLMGILVLVKLFSPSPIVSWMLLIVSMTMILRKAQKEKVSDDEGKYFYPRIFVISVVVIFIGIAFSISDNSSMLFLLACTNALIAISKIMERKM